LQYGLLRIVNFDSSAVKLQVSLEIFIDRSNWSPLFFEWNMEGPLSICCGTPEYPFISGGMILFFLLMFMVFLVTSYEFSFKVEGREKIFDHDGV